MWGLHGIGLDRLAILIFPPNINSILKSFAYYSYQKVVLFFINFITHALFSYNKAVGHGTAGTAMAVPVFFVQPRPTFI